MNVYNKSTIIEFYKKHKEVKLALQVWYEEVELNQWKTPNALKQFYGGALSVLKNNRVVFNIKGNHYRLVASINYEKGWVFIKFIGKHNEYDKIDANSIDRFEPKPKTNPGTEN